MATFSPPPQVLPQFIDAWQRGAEVVVGVRRSRWESRKFMAFPFPLFYRVLGALSDYPIPLNAGIFGLMDRKVVDSVLALRERNRYLPGLRAWVGFKNSIVYYDRQDRARGEGKVFFLSRIKYAMDAITSFIYKPLRLSFGLFGFATEMAFLCALCMPFCESPLETAGFGISSAVSFVGGLLLLSVGILKEYVGRVYDEFRGRPLSLVAHVHRTEVPLETGIATFEVPVEGYGIPNGGLAIQSITFQGPDAA